MAIITHYEKRSFEELVKDSFGFAESEAGMVFGGVRTSGGDDPREAVLVARYLSDCFRFDVGWSEYDISLAVLVNFE